MENLGRKPKEWCFRNVTIYSLVCCLILNTSLPVALAGPAGGVVDTGLLGGGPADITYGDGLYGHTTSVNVHTNQTIIDWTSLDSLGGAAAVRETLAFTQGALSNSAVLNRVSGAATQFNGDLTAAGMRIFVVNPAGIVFGSGSTVNVAQLVASGLNMSNQAFQDVLDDPANDMVFEGGAGIVRNQATINANSVILVGKKVFNQNGIVAPAGLIVLAAGDNVYLAQDGSQVLVEVADVGDGTADVVNRSLLNADNGDVVLAASDTFGAILNSGYINARGGTITARAARVEQTGVMDTSAPYAGEAGSITLTGTQEVVLDTQESGGLGTVTANSYGINGNGGSITVESEGTVTLREGTLVSARGGSASGDGGSVKITAEHFVVSGDIDASPQNVDFEPGTLQISSPSVTIANGVNTGEMDTIYEQDIETLSDKGTSLVINSEQGITVPDIVDGEIKGRYGNIELYGTGTDSFVSFADTTDTISTTLGDILIGAGSGGLNIGNLETAKDLSDTNPTPGEIILSTSNRGNITVENLLIKGGWGHAEINVNASGELTVNGNVIVGGDSPIRNIPSGQDAEAMIFLKSGDNMLLNGNVTANAHGLNAGIEGDITKAYVGIFSGTNETWFGNLTINGDLTAKAISSSAGTSDATIEIDSWGTLAWGPQAADPLADGDSAQVHVESKESASDTNVEGDIAQIIVNTQGNAPQMDGAPDFQTTHMGTLVEGNVLDNDRHPEGGLLGALLVNGPSHAESFTFNESFILDGGGSYSYTPEAGYVGDDTFTYVAYSVDGGDLSDPVLVTITMTNTAPVARAGTATTHMGAIYAGTVANSISDPENDPLTTDLATGPGHGTLTMNLDGTYSYTPQAGYVGDDTFTYSATDGEIGAEPVQAIVTITMTNTPPTPDTDVAATTQGVPVVINVLANDSDPEGDPLKVSSFTYTGTGTVAINANNTLTYTPGKNFIGQESFSYSATDGQIGGTPVTTTVMVTVGPATTPPPAYFMPTGPDLDKTDVGISGCPALTKWAAEEIGASRRRMEIWIVNGLASMRGVQPCDACTNLREAAKILVDAEGIHAAAVAQIIDEFGSSIGPITEELAAYITNAMAHDSGTRAHYAIAEEYFGALAEYMGVLHNDMGFSVEKAAQIVAKKYIDPLAGSGNVGVASYVAARLDSVTMFLAVVRLNRGKETPRIKH